MPHVLDNPAWAALVGPHRHLAEVNGRAARYRPEVSTFVALDDPGDHAAWPDLAALVGPGADVAVGAVAVDPPPGWAVRWQGEGLQLVQTAPAEVAPDAEVERLTGADLPEILDLVDRTDPGPFRPRTIEMGTYLGVRRAGRLVAMAGERMRPPGYTEVSAVCTDQAYRRQGLAGRLIRAVTAGIRDRGDTPYLHVLATNETALRLYRSLGFEVSRRTTFVALTVPR